MRPVQLLLFGILLITGSSSYSQKRYPHLASKFKEYDSLLLLAQFSKVDSIKAAALNNLANRSFFYTISSDKKFEPVEEYAQQALQTGKKIKSKTEIIKATYVLAVIDIEKNKLAEALRLLFGALKLAKEINNTSYLSNLHNRIGILYTITGNYSEALTHFKQQQAYVDKLEDPGMSRVNMNRYTAEVYHELGNFNAALFHFFEAYKESVSRKVGNSKGIYYRYIGKVYRDMENYDEAIKYHVEALSNTMESSRFPLHLAMHYTDLGTLYIHKARKASEQDKIPHYQQSLEYLKQGLKYEYAADKKTLLELYNSLGDAYQGISDHKNAIVFARQYTILKDSLYNLQTLNKIAELKAHHDMEDEITREKMEHQLALVSEKIQSEKILSSQKMESEKAIAEQRTAHALDIAKQQYQLQIKIDQEKMVYDKNLALEKAKQEHLRTQQEKMKIIWLLSVAGILLISVLGFLLWRQYILKNKAVDKASMQRQLAELELQSLRAQLNPHFMFNSLNSIQQLILSDNVQKSHAYLARFSKLLRMMLENADKPFISLQTELDFLQLYLDMENLRLPDLQFSILKSSQLDSQATYVPNMMLQPHIENAIWHGLSHKPSDKRLEVRIYRENGMINYEIEDNGVGRKKSAELKNKLRKNHRSIGTELLTKRFKLLNEEFRTEIETVIKDVDKDDELPGTIVTVKVPVKLNEQFKQRIYASSHN